MKPKKRIQEMTFAALLTAIAILIPSIMPIKLIIPPASYTLGSHVPLFLAMFISPWVAAFVILASSLGFIMAGYPIVIVFRAFSHIIFGCLGALYLKKFPQTIENHKSTLIFNFVLGDIHALGEVIACVIFYSVTGEDFQKLSYILFVLVGFGTIVHSMIDYVIALTIFKSIRKIRKLPDSYRHGNDFRSRCFRYDRQPQASGRDRGRPEIVWNGHGRRRYGYRLCGR